MMLFANKINFIGQDDIFKALLILPDLVICSGVPNFKGCANGLT